MRTTQVEEIIAALRGLGLVHRGPAKDFRAFAEIKRQRFSERERAYTRSATYSEFGPGHASLLTRRANDVVAENAEALVDAGLTVTVYRDGERVVSSKVSTVYRRPALRVVDVSRLEEWERRIAEVLGEMADWETERRSER